MAENHSFLPEDYLEKRAQKRTNFISLTLFVIVMAGVVAAFYVTDQQRREVRDLQSQVNGQFEEAARRLDQFEKLQAQREQMIHKAQVTGTLIERVPRSVLLAELINSMPVNLSLLELNVDTKVLARAPAPKSAMERARNTKAKKKDNDAEPARIQPPETQVEITLIGVAPTDVQVAQFMTSLGHNEMFTDQHLGFSEEAKVKNASMRKFRVGIQIAPGVDVQRHQPKMVKRDSVPNPMSDRMEITPGQAFDRQIDAQRRSDAIPNHD